jgi:hypothetical protein
VGLTCSLSVQFEYLARSLGLFPKPCDFVTERCLFASVSRSFAPTDSIAAIIVASRPAWPSNRISSIVIEGSPQQTQVAPERDIVPVPIFLSYSRRCAPLPPWVAAFSPVKMLNTGPVLSAFGSTLSRTRLLSFLHSHLVLSSGIVARQFLHLTVRAQR